MAKVASPTIRLLRSWIVWVAFGSAMGVGTTFAADKPTIAIHPAVPSANDEVFVAHFDYYCGSYKAPSREAIPGGWRISVPVESLVLAFMFQYPQLCLQSIGVLGAGRHEIVPVPDSADSFSRHFADALSSTVLSISPDATAATVDLWSYEPAAMDALWVPAFAHELLRLSNSRFAAIVREADRDRVIDFGIAAGDWRRIDTGFPALMQISTIDADAHGNIYAVAAPRDPPGSSPSIWRLDSVAGIWARYASYAPEYGAIAAVLRDGTIIASTITYPGYRLARFSPCSGWSPLASSTTADLGELRNFTRDGDDDLYGLFALWQDGVGFTYSLIRISTETGEILSRSIIPPGPPDHNWTALSLATDPNGVLMLIGSGRTDVTPFKTLDRARPGGGWERLASELRLFPFALGADGSHLTTDTADVVLRYQPLDSTPIAVAAGGLQPRGVCGDPSYDASHRPVAFPFCRRLTDTNIRYNGPLDGALEIDVAGIGYLVQWNGTTLALMRRAGTFPPAQYLDLTPTLGTAVKSPWYQATPIRLVALPDRLRLFVLLYHTVAGDGYSSSIVEIDLAGKTATAIDLPPLMAADMAVSPSGKLYVTTRFGEILRRPPNSGEWSTFGHLTTRHSDLHVAIDAAERVFTYGYQGVMSQQGVGARAEEFHHVGLDHYFMTADPAEARSLHDNPALGWNSTGESFPAIAALPWGPYPGAPREVCRFYGSVNPGPNSHFYTGVVSECSGLKLLQQSTPATEPRWNYEGTAFHSITGLAGGSCPATAQMVVRFFNGGSAKGLVPNHRYVQGAALKAQMNAAGWIAEESAFCVPNEEFARVYAR